MSNPRTTLPLSALLNAAKFAPPRKQLTATTLNQFPGLRIGSRRGQGLEFDDLREYLSGDDIRHIDWNVTARSGEPHTRVYREEREHTTTVIVDLQPSMFTGSHALLAVRAGELAAATLWQAMRQGDRCAAVVFSCHGIRASRPASGKRGVLKACELIADEFAKMRNGRTTQARSESGLDMLFNWFDTAGRQTGTKLLFSGLEQRAVDQWPDKLNAAGLKHRLIAILLLDTLETSALQVGRYRYKSYSGTQSTIARVSLNTAAAQLVQQQLDASHQLLRAQFHSAQVPLLAFSSDCKPVNFLAELTARKII